MTFMDKIRNFIKPLQNNSLRKSQVFEFILKTYKIVKLV